MDLLPLFDLYWDKIIKKADMKRIHSQSPTQGIKEITNVSYIKDNKWQHYLDIYLPEDTKQPQPVIIDIHGGGWMYGTKEINKYYNMVLASRGFTVFSINYTLVPEGGIDTQLQECMLAFKWIKENAEQYFGDINRLFVTGDSAGGFLAVFSTMLNNSETLRRTYSTISPELEIKALALTSPMCYMEDNEIQGKYTKPILGKNYESSKYYGYVNLDKALKVSSLPPTFLVTSGGDFPARKQTIRAFEDLEDNNVKCKLINLPDKKLMHVFSVTDPYSPASVDIIDRMLDFFEKHITVLNH